MKDFRNPFNTGSRAVAHQGSSSHKSGIGFSAPIQRYKTDGTKKVSVNKDYFVDSAASAVLSVRSGATPPSPAGLIIANGNQVQYKNSAYDEYHFDPTKNFVNDCLGFAENVARGTDVDSNRGEFRAVGDRPNGTDRLFGQSDRNNTDIANGSWAQDEFTDPGIGEAYGITRSVEPVRGETPYHVAAVVAKDGSDNVTIEADASDVGRAVPIFDMYGTVPPGKRKGAQKNSLTFYETYEGTYESYRGARKKRKRYAPSSGVLRLRND